MPRKMSRCTRPTREMNMQKMQQLNYSKVLTPKNMKSSVWKYFGFPGNSYNQVITKNVIYCTLCFTSFKNNRNTTNLRMHLNRSHKNYTNSDIESCADSEMIMGLANKSQKTGCLIKTKIKNDFFVPQNGNPLSESLVDDMTLYNVAHDPQTCMDDEQLAESITEIPTKSTSSIIADTDPNEQEVNVKDFKIEDNIYLESPTLNVQDILRDMIIEDILPTDIIGRKGFESTIKILSKGYSMPQKEEVEESILNAYLKKSNRIFETLKFHSLHKSFALSYEIWENIVNQRYITFYFYYISDDFAISFKDVQLKTVKFSQYTNIEEIFDGYHLRNCTAIVGLHNELIDEYFSKFDVPLVPCFECAIKNCISKAFNLFSVHSIYTEVKEYFEELLLSQDIGIPNLYRELPWTKYNVLHFFCENICWPDDPNNELLPKAKSILETIAHLKMTVDSLAEESNTISSLSRPLSNHLIENNFSTVKSDSFMVGEIKEAIHVELANSILKSDLLSASSFLDPRFCRFLSDDCIKNIKDSLYIKMNKEEIDSTSAPNILNETATKQSKKSGLMLLFSKSSSNPFKSMNVNNFENDFRKYRIEAAADLDECPLDWWNKYGYMYGRLKKLADVYNCVPACCNNRFLFSIEARTTFEDRRANLTGNCINEILFLNYNK